MAKDIPAAKPDAKDPIAAARKRPTHPPTSKMVHDAIETLAERQGSSVQAIKKYISTNFSADVVKLAFYIKKYLINAVTAGEIVQTKGRGASGSFKLAPAGKTTSATKKAKAASGEKKAKATASGVKKSSGSKKVAPSVEKSKATEKPKEQKKPAPKVKAASSASADKAPKEKSTKSSAAAKKPKSPKPKKASPVKKAAAKKAAATPKKK